MPKDITKASDAETSSEPDSPEVIFNEACNLMREGNYEKAIEMFEDADKKRGESTPDTQRNLGWCNYRLGERALIRTEHDDSLRLFTSSREFYRQAEEGFRKMQEERHSPELKERIATRIQDCRFRVGGIRSFGEFMHHKHEYTVELHKKAEEEKAAQKVPEATGKLSSVSVRVAPPKAR